MDKAVLHKGRRGKVPEFQGFKVRLARHLLMKGVKHVFYADGRASGQCSG